MRRTLIQLSHFLLTNGSTGKTSVLHDSEDSIDVGHCPDPGCYSREIVYSATMRQITTLVELSDECHQSIKVSYRIESVEKITPMQIKDAYNYSLSIIVRLQLRSIRDKRCHLQLVGR
jgi:hypothetical protein